MRRAIVVAAALALGGCVTGGKLRAQAESVRVETDKARKSGGARCAPKELALADANLDFANAELEEGNAGRAAQHLTAAEANARKANELSRDCAPRVTIKRDAVPLPPPPKPVVIVKKTEDRDGDGIPDDIDRCPLDPEDKDGFQDEDGCPDPDNDGDGIVDAMDACPNNAGQLENRGCPVVDVDTDGDGILDRLDKCPAVPGPAPDGCPKKYTLVEVKKDHIAIKQQVKYATNKFAVLKASFRLLDQVVQVLTDYPKMKVRIEGHTDSVGGEAKNLTLSQRRADAVKAYLVKKGIAPERLEAVGFGPTKPIASNRSEKGRQQNRRTEFRIAGYE
ncbi:MAG TPA: OmpA family protein [Anaeromyxobacteraceae bacterium]|jgi:outer membrane protein OmpA-like peptidoglycan-associated protein